MRNDCDDDDYEHESDAERAERKYLELKYSAPEVQARMKDFRKTQQDDEDRRLRDEFLQAKQKSEPAPAPAAASSCRPAPKHVPVGVVSSAASGKTTSSIGQFQNNEDTDCFDYDDLPPYKDSGIRFYNWFLTCFTSEALSTRHKDVKFFICKMEICPTTNREHCHMYIEFKQKKSMKWIKHHFNNDTINCQPRQGTAAQAIAYIKKEESTKPGCVPEIYGEPKRAGNRSDLDAMADAVIDGASKVEMLMTFKGNALRHLGMIDRAQRCINGIDKVDNAIIARRLIVQEMENSGCQEEAQKLLSAPLSLTGCERANEQVMGAILAIIEEGTATNEEAENEDKAIDEALGEEPAPRVEWKKNDSDIDSGDDNNDTGDE